MKITLAQAAEALAKASTLLLTAHVNPDGDAVGSCLGLAAYLRQQGKTARVILPDEVPDNLRWLPEAGTIEMPTDEKIAADLVVILDTDGRRIGGVAAMLPEAPILNIDHHRTNNEAADMLYCDIYAASNTENIYDLLTLMDADFNLDIALPLYTGMMTDTGFFHFANARPATYRAAAVLVENGVRPDLVAESIEKMSYQRAECSVETYQSMEPFFGGRVIGLFLPLELTKRVGNTDGLINFVRAIDTCEVAVLIKQLDETSCRVSLRSRSVDVTTAALKFGGGGHRRAAGCTIHAPLAEAKKQLLAAVAELLEITA